MVYGHVTGTTVDSIGQPPHTIFDGVRWWDLRDRNPSTLALAGWYLITEAARPADTETITWVSSYVYSENTITQVWTQREKTVEEIENELVNSERNILLTQLASGIADITAARTAAQDDIAQADILKGQADALSNQIATHITQIQAFAPGATYSQAQMNAIRDAIVAITQRQKSITDAMGSMYQYRKAVDQNAVTTDNAILWLARIVSDNIID
jgi:hypothetical protein